MQKLRLHIIAILTITIVITMLYRMLIQPAPPPPGSIKVDTISVVSATYGENCNNMIRRAIQRGVKPEVQLDRYRNELPLKPYEIVKRNNVIDIVKQRCNGQAYCEFRVDKGIFLYSPIMGCFSDFDLSYRCYDLDRLRIINIREGQIAKLDCRPKDQQPAEPAPAPEAAPAPQPSLDD